MLMTKLVETEIEKELTKTEGAIVHDAWTNNGWIIYEVSYG